MKCEDFLDEQHVTADDPFTPVSNDLATDPPNNRESCLLAMFSSLTVTGTGSIPGHGDVSRGSLQLEVLVLSHTHRVMLESCLSWSPPLFTFFRKSPSWNSPLPIVSRTRRYAKTNWLQPLAPLEIHGDVHKDATSCWSSRRARVDLRIIIALLFK